VKKGARAIALRAATITVLQAAHHGLGNDAATLWGFHRTRLRSIMAQPPIRARLVVIPQVSGKKPSQMPLVPADDVIQQLAADGTNQAFPIRILPGRTRRRHHFLDVQVSQAATHLGAVDAIAVAEHGGIVGWEKTTPIDSASCCLRTRLGFSNG
jgi:hypothetical protein